MHFKLSNRNVINAAWNGNQKMSSTDFYGRMNLPYFNPKNPEATDSDGWSNSFDNSRLNSYVKVGSNSNGGLAINLFGSEVYSSYWNVVGEDPKKPVFECGTYHRSNGENSDNDSSKASTLHQVYFKGKPPSDEEVRNRMVANINKLEKS